MKFAIVGIGYVGLSNAILLAQLHCVVALDINVRRVEQLNALQSPIDDVEIGRYLAEKMLNLSATTDAAIGALGHPQSS